MTSQETCHLYLKKPLREMLGASPNLYRFFLETSHLSEL